MVAGCLVAGVAAGLNPLLGISIGFGAALMLVVLADITWGLLVFIVPSFFDIVRFEGGSLTTTKVLGLALCGSWLATVATGGRRASNDFFARHTGYTLALALFLGWVALSALWAEDAGQVFTAVQRYGLNMLLLPIVYTAVRERRHVTWILAAFVTGTLVSTAYGLVFPVPPDPGALSRLGSAVGDANQTATVLIAAIVLCAALLGAARRASLLSLLVVLAGVIAMAALANTLSRGGMASLGLTLVIGAILGGRWRRYVIFLAVATVAGTLIYFLFVAPSSVRSRVQSGDSTGRSDLWKVALREAEDHPILGVGAGNFSEASVHYLVQPGTTTRADFIVDVPKVAHNIYLEQLAELGAVGLALFLSIPFLSLRCAYLAAQLFRQLDDRFELVARAVMVATLGVLAAGFFVSGQYSKQLWLLIALGPALLSLAERRTTT